MRENWIRNVLHALDGHSLVDFIQSLCASPAYSDCPTTTLFVAEIPDLLDFILGHTVTKSKAGGFILQHFTTALTSEIAALADRESGWHFSARNATAKQIEAFSVEGMARKLEDQAPVLWVLLDRLLASDPSCEKRRAHARMAGVPTATIGAWDQEDEYWHREGELPDDEPCGEDEGVQHKRKRRRRAAGRSQALHKIVST
jgi:hypothetical protein